MSRQCVYEYLRLQQPPERTHIPPSRQPIPEPYKDYLIRRWNEGCRNAQQAYREVKEQGYPGSDSNIVRFFGHLRKHFNQSGTFKEVDPATQTPVQAPPKHPPTASQVAHWMTFKEEQRLDWQQKHLTQLCEADQEIREAYELVADFTSMLRERQGERLDAWLEKAETHGIAELKNFAQGNKKRLRRGESWPHPGVEQWPDRGPGAPLETLKETNVWPRPLRSPTETSSQASLEKALSTSTSMNHQKFGRP